MNGFATRPLPLLFVLAAGCAAPVVEWIPPQPGEPSHEVAVVRQGWHTGIALRRTEIALEEWPEIHYFGAFEKVEVGWGERRFYQDAHTTWLEALYAGLWPTDSALHLAGVSIRPDQDVEQSEVYYLTISEEGFRRMVAYISDSFDRKGEAKATPLAPGIYGDGRFFKAKGKFYLPKTCNTWTARALREAGYPIASDFVPFAWQITGSLERQKNVRKVEAD